MECKMRKDITVGLSTCDHTGTLAVPHLFSLFMDLASEHGDAIGLGMDALSRHGLFWLTVKTKIRITRRPRLLERITADTWPEKPGRIRCNRFYRLTDGRGELLAEGKTEWTMLEVATGRLAPLSAAYPPELEHCEDVVCDAPYARIGDDFADAPEIAVYTVRSADIDVGRHMNNAAYVHALFGSLSCTEREAITVREADVHFRTPCFEGERLSVRRRDMEDGMEFGIVREDGKTAAAFRLILE